MAGNGFKLDICLSIAHMLYIHKAQQKTIFSIALKYMTELNIGWMKDKIKVQKSKNIPDKYKLKLEFMDHGGNT